jgi:myo-inositol 2-dehydrogenase / D-chiro-inositol 1-dehydrogenase
MINRREGLRTAALTALSYSRVLGANERMRGGLVGCGVRGVGYALRALAPQADVQMVAACDVYQPNLDKALSDIGAKDGKANGYTDYRKLIERKDLDFVVVATPDHWHAPISVAACATGKDVYVEKPLANSVEDCLAVVDAADKYKRVVQVGVQQRSMKTYSEALRMIKEGAIGPVIRRCTMTWGRDGTGGRRGNEPETKPPDGLDWEAFQGPAPHRPYRASRQHAWRSYWDYGSGAITDFGVHLLDVMQWFIGDDSPRVCYGAGYHSTGESMSDRAPDVLALTWKYDHCLGTYLTTRDSMWDNFWGDLGILSVNRGALQVQLFKGRFSERSEMQHVNVNRDPGDQSAHMRNFLDCMRTRRKPNADAETGCKSTIPCLLAAMSVRTGKSYHFDWNAKSVRQV